MERSHNTRADYHILLIGNYPPDNQHSMRRYAELLQSELSNKSHSVELLSPPVIFGKLGAGPSGIGKWIGYLDKYVLFPFFLKWKLKRSPKPTVVHICDHSNAIYTPHLSKVPHLVTCHDLFAVRSARGEFQQNQLRRSGRTLQAIILKGLKQSQCIVSISEATNEDVARIVSPASASTHIIPNPIQEVFLKETAETNSSTAIQLNSPFVLHVGNDSWYKNRGAAVRIYAALLNVFPKLHFYYVGPELSDEDLSHLPNGIQEPQLQHFNSISDEELKQLYTHARILLFPSIIEGFGWPIMEAQACGCPVASLDTPPMNTLNQTAALQLNIDTGSREWPKQAAEQCLPTIQASAEEREEMSQSLQKYARQFTTKATVQAYQKIYAQLASAYSR